MKSYFHFFIALTISLCLSAQDIHSGLKFQNNKGQWGEKVKYKADLPGGKFFVEDNVFTYVFYDQNQVADLHDHEHETKKSDLSSNDHIETKSMINMHAFRVRLVGASEHVEMKASHLCPERYNYYKGNDPSKWGSDVQAHKELLLKNVYPHTDLRFYEAEQTMKYEFILHPGANPARIKMKYEGLSDISIQKGNLVVKTSVNNITEKAPYLYQTRDGKQVQVNGKFKLRDSIVTFDVRSYDRALPLVIDPQLIFSTYSGSTADNWGNTAAFDDDGNMYSGGTVFNIGFPATIGAFQQSFAGSVDIGILKFNPTGTNLFYATYLGGDSIDIPFSLVVNSQQELIIMGTTSSLDYPTTAGAFDPTFGGGTQTLVLLTFYLYGSDLFLSKLSNTGAALAASTYIGGNGSDGAQSTFDFLVQNYGDELRGDVTVDDQDNVYVACNTRSTTFPTSAGAYRTTNNGTKDVCVFKMNTTFTTMLWGTYLGGSAEDAAYSIQVDSLYNVYVAGGTASANFPVTAGAYQQTLSGNIDGFVSRISSDGTTLMHSTLTGTPNYDQAYFVQLDNDGNVYLLGQTRGNYPVSDSVYTNPNGGHFVHGFTPELDSTLWSTVFGTGGLQPNISPTAFLVNDCGNIFISGWGGFVNRNYMGGSTNNLPVTADAYRSISDGSDFYIMVLSKGARDLLYATFFGYNTPPSSVVGYDHVDGGTSRFDKKGIIYEAVCGGCRGGDLFPTTPGAWSNTNGSTNCNNAAFKFDLTFLEALFTPTRSIQCELYQVTVTNQSVGGKTFFWDFGDGHTTTAKNPGTHTYDTAGNYTITLIATDLTTCIAKDTFITSVFMPAPPPITLNVLDTSVCLGSSVQLIATSNPTYDYFWTPSLTLNNGTVANPIATPLINTIYHLTVRDTNSCETERDITVVVNPLPTVEAGPMEEVCPQVSRRLHAVGTGTFLWETSPYLSCFPCQEPLASPPDNFDDYFTVQATNEFGCKAWDSVRVRVLPYPLLSIDLRWTGRCYENDVIFMAELRKDSSSCDVPGGGYLWTFGDGTTSTDENPTHQYSSAGNYPITVQYAYSNIARDTAVVLSNDSCRKNVFIPNTFTPNGDGRNDLVYVRTLNATKILFRIFNRWGEEVFRTESLHEGWDGTYKNIKQTPQTFVYTADVTFYDNEHKVIEGNITLME